MKPLSVLVLVLLAVGALFFAISNLPGDEEAVDRPDPGTALADPTPTPEGPDSSGTLPGGPGRESVLVDPPGPRKPVVKDGISFDNQLVGMVVDPENKPVSGADVVLTRSSAAANFFVNTEVDRSGDREMTTGSDGKFIFSNVKPHEHYAIEVSHADFSRAVATGVNVGMEGKFEEPTIVLTQGASLSGVVRAQDGGGIAGAMLYLDSMFFQAGNEPNPDRLSAVADSFGAYKFENIAAGHRSLLVEADGFANALVNGLNFRKDGAIDRDITLDVAEMICGLVVGPSNNPVPGAEVQALSFSNSGQQCREITQTGDDGRFCLESLSPGKYLVAVRATGFQPANKRSVQAGDTNVLLEMKIQATVSGRVIDAETGAPITNFSCMLRQTFDGVNDTTPTSIKGSFNDPEGKFELLNASPGAYLVEASAEGYAPAYSEKFRVNQGGSVGGIVVRLGKGAKIVGVVLDASGAPLARARVLTKPNDWTGSAFDEALGNMLPSNITQAETFTKQDGSFELTNLRSEKYQIRIKGSSLCEYIATDVEVPASGSKDMGSIQLIEGGLITGTVFDQAGQAVANARISMRIDGRTSEPPRFYNAKANGAGKYTVRSVYPGNYVIQAQPPRSAGGDFMDDLTTGSANRPTTAVDGKTTTVELKLGN